MLRRWDIRQVAAAGGEQAQQGQGEGDEDGGCGLVGFLDWETMAGHGVGWIRFQDLKLFCGKKDYSFGIRLSLGSFVNPDGENVQRMNTNPRVFYLNGKCS